MQVRFNLLVLSFLESLQIRHASARCPFARSIGSVFGSDFCTVFYALIRSSIDYTVLNNDQVVRFTSTSFSVSRPASPMKARAISVWFCCINGTPRSIAVDTAKY